MLQVPALMPKFGVSKGAGKRYRRIRRRHGVAQQQKTSQHPAYSLKIPL